jgi:hypothetical protein
MTDEVKDGATAKDVDVDTDTTNDEGDGVEETPEVLKKKLEEANKAKSQLTARAKTAEARLKELEANPQGNNKSNDPQLSDELKLIARGLSDEAIEQAKVIAKGKGLTLTEAIKDPLFEIYQKDLAEKERREKAKLGASKGSSESQEEITGFQAGATREEHEKAYKKLVGKK